MRDILRQHNVTVTGAGNKTLLFANGFGTDQSFWRHVTKAFQDEYRIVMFDNTGSGTTDPSLFSPHKYNRLHAYADDLLGISEALNLEDAIMVGHSVSGMVGLLSVLRAPQRFEKLVMIGASPRYLNDEGYVGGFEQADLDGFYEAMETNYYAWVGGFAPAAMHNADRPELASEFAGTLGAVRPDIAQSVSRVIFQSDHRADLPLLKKPALIIQADEDIAVPQAVGAYLHSQISGSQLANIQAKGHFPHLSAPHQVIEAIRPFIAQA